MKKKREIALAVGAGIVAGVAVIAALSGCGESTPDYSIHYQKALFDAHIPRLAHGYLERDWAPKVCDLRANDPTADLTGIRTTPDNVPPLNINQTAAALRAAEQFICPNVQGSR